MIYVQISEPTVLLFRYKCVHMINIYYETLFTKYRQKETLRRENAQEYTVQRTKCLTSQLCYLQIYLTPHVGRTYHTYYAQRDHQYAASAYSSANPVDQKHYIHNSAPYY